MPVQASQGVRRPQEGRSYRRSLRQWLRSRLSHEQRTVTLAGLLFVVAIVAVVRYYATPERLRAPRDVELIGTGLKSTFTSESIARVVTGTYADPGPMFRRQARALGVGYVTVQASEGDQNHWFLKLRDDSAATVCTHLVTFQDERDVVRPSCRTVEVWDR
jgi:hypothetical protein